MPSPTGAVNSEVIRIAHYHYIHVINLTTNVTRLILGPKTYLCPQDENVVVGPEKMIVVPPMKYCVIKNPVIRNEDGTPVFDANGQAELKAGDEEYRFHQEPFPLYPGEELKGSIEALPVVPVNCAFLLESLTNCVDHDGVERIAGERWLFEGPGTYYPLKEVKVVKSVEAETIESNTALCLEATRTCTDRAGIRHVHGDRWLVRKPGLYLPGPYEKVVEKRVAYKVTEKIALHVRAIASHVDEFGKKRRFGDEWLVTSKDTDSYICSVYEEVVSTVNITVLSAHKYCIVLNPVDENGMPQLGKKKLVKGETSFFLNPGEELQYDVEDSYILKHDEGLILRAVAEFEDEVDSVETPVGPGGGEPVKAKRKVTRRPGDRWTVRGPLEYVPPIEVEVHSRISLIPLDQNEGIYVRNTKTGTVRTVIGRAYMLTEDEELWEKKLPQDVIELLSSNKDPLADRGAYAAKMRMDSVVAESQPTIDLTRVVTFPVPHNAAVQVYDYKENRARVEFGPTLVMLGPDEQFTRLSLSGGKPKKPNVIKTLCLLLGPDFCTDVVVVETADHARLSLQLSYNWHFEVPQPCSEADAAKLFSVPDFIGDACKAIASRIRGKVASVKFDDFHRNSCRIIRVAVFGEGRDNRVNDEFVLPQNNLHITSIDIQSVEPVDQRTRDSLQKSVQLAIEITTNSQEAAARHEAERVEQEARGRLERQKILDETAAEEARRSLLETRVQLASLESTGQAKAEAISRAEALHIEGEANVEQARLRADAVAIDTDSELERLRKARAMELEYIKEKDSIKLHTLTEQMKVEVTRFTAMVNAIGADTLKAIANAGPEHNIRMLSALGLRSTLITDGTTPVNLLTTAHGLIGRMMDHGEMDISHKVSRKSPAALKTKTDVVPEEDDDASTVMEQH